MSTLQVIENYLSQNHSRFEADLFEWLRIPSISTDSAYDSDTRRAASWIHEKFGAAGLKSEWIETCGQPLVFAESAPVSGAPTILIYGHYDVQPPDPLELWESPPFDPQIRDGKIFARGATDDKGQMITHLFAVETFLQSGLDLPLQVKFLIEGEEESGGAGLKSFLHGEVYPAEQVRQKLSADIAVISDSSQHGPGQPAITVGLRGMIHCEVHLSGPNKDLHSGAYGGTVANPGTVLSKLIASFTDQQNRVTLPGFYENVLELSESEREEFRHLDFSETDYQSETGVSSLSGEPGYSTLERRWCRPAFEVHGLNCGYQGAGAKTIIPATASAKFSFRLVAKQDPDMVKQSIRNWLEERCPPGIEMRLEMSDGAPGFLVPRDNPFLAAAATAIQQGFGKPPVMIRSGGSIPVVSQFLQMPGVDTLLLGWGQNDDNLHSPNEKFSVADFHAGIKTAAILLKELAKVSAHHTE